MKHVLVKDTDGKYAVRTNKRYSGDMVIQELPEGTQIVFVNDFDEPDEIAFAKEDCCNTYVYFGEDGFWKKSQWDGLDDIVGCSSNVIIWDGRLENQQSQTTIDAMNDVGSEQVNSTDELFESLKDGLGKIGANDGKALVLPSKDVAPIKSDGGSSGYYFSKLPQHVIDDIVERGGIEIKDIVRYCFDNDADCKDIIKALKRIREYLKGGGKEGTTALYDMNKIDFFTDELRTYLEYLVGELDEEI